MVRILLGLTFYFTGENLPKSESQDLMQFLLVISGFSVNNNNNNFHFYNLIPYVAKKYRRKLKFFLLAKFWPKLPKDIYTIVP